MLGVLFPMHSFSFAVFLCPGVPPVLNILLLSPTTSPYLFSLIENSMPVSSFNAFRLLNHSIFFSSSFFVIHICFSSLSFYKSFQLRQALKYLRFQDRLIIPLSLFGIMLVSSVRFRHFVFTLRCLLCCFVCDYIIHWY